ncbi:MAG: PEGA domain-containing protein [Ignavibacteriales bacterium]|nr:PEGA domain-containing protein [Ignavibacteriales bacterium]
MSVTYFKSIAVRTLPIVLVFIFSLPFLSCATTENPVTPVDPVKGKVFFLSSPSKAKIFINGVSTDYYTGDTLVLAPGKHDITLKYNLFQDTTFSVTAVANQLTVLPIVQLKNSTSIGTLIIFSNILFASVYIDNQKVGETNQDIRLNSGTYNVTVKEEYFNDTTFSVVIFPNQKSIVSNIILSLIPNLGILSIDSSPPGAQVYINGSYTLSSTRTTKYLEAGNYSVTLKKDTYKDTTFNVTVVAGQTLERNITLVQTTVNITSAPAGATIYVNNINNGITPSAVGLPSGTSSFRLSLSGYWDSTFTVSDQQANQTISIILTPNEILEFSVRIYESSAPVNLAHGLMLSQGRALSIFGTFKDSVDIYFTGSYLASAHSFNLSKTTYFRIGNGTNLSDGVDAPPKDGTWKSNSNNNSQGNYFFLYTSDQHYVKMIVTGGGGGSGSHYLDLRYFFKKTKNDVKF